MLEIILRFVEGEFVINNKIKIFLYSLGLFLLINLIVILFPAKYFPDKQNQTIRNSRGRPMSFFDFIFKREKNTKDSKKIAEHLEYINTLKKNAIFF